MVSCSRFYRHGLRQIQQHAQSLEPPVQSAWPDDDQPNVLCQQPLLFDPAAQAYGIQAGDLAALDPRSFWDGFDFPSTPELLGPDGGEFNRSPTATPDGMSPDIFSPTSLIPDFPSTPSSDPDAGFPALELSTAIQLSSTSSPEPSARLPSHSPAQRRKAPPHHKRAHSPESSNGSHQWKASKPKAHREIERKYRSTICTRIQVLKDCLPTLREAAVPASKDSDSGSDQPSGPGMTKATVLTEAVRYIQDMQEQIERIGLERDEWKARSIMFEKILTRHGPGDS